MRLAPAGRRHMPEICELMTASSLLQRYGVTRRVARAGLEEALSARDTMIVALDGGEVIGLAWAILTRALDRAAYLRLLLVAEGRHSSGVGTALLGEAERRARVAGCRHMVLVTATNRRARAFYARQDYRYVGKLPGFARPGIAEAIYVKSWKGKRHTAEPQEGVDVSTVFSRVRSAHTPAEKGGAG